MTLYQKMLVFYTIMGVICTVISWFLTKGNRVIRLLVALLIGATWPFSFPMALLTSLSQPQVSDDRKGWRKG